MTAQKNEDGTAQGVADEILTERMRQVESEGWTPEHDDAHDEGQLARAAACYAAGPDFVTGGRYQANSCRGWDDNCYQYEFVTPPIELGKIRWPFDEDWRKHTNARRDLIKAAALIVAEIERLDRADSKLAQRAEGE